MCRMQYGCNGWGRLLGQSPTELETTGPSARCGRRQRTPKRRLTGVTGFHSVHEMGRAPQPIAEFKSSVCGQLGRLQNSRDMEPVRGLPTPISSGDTAKTDQAWSSERSFASDRSASEHHSWTSVRRI